MVLQTLQLLLAKSGQTDIALPKAAVDSDALAALTVLMNGDTSAVGLSGAEDAADLGVAQPPGFSSAERLQILSGSPASCGALALAATQAQKLLSANSATLAIACEALKGSSGMFSDMKLPDVSASKNVSAVASDVIALLESSTFVNRKPKDGGIGTIGSVVKVCSSRTHVAWGFALLLINIYWSQVAEQATTLECYVPCALRFIPYTCFPALAALFLVHHHTRLNRTAPVSGVSIHIRGYSHRLVCLQFPDKGRNQRVYCLKPRTCAYLSMECNQDHPADVSSRTSQMMGKIFGNGIEERPTRLPIPVTKCV